MTQKLLSLSNLTASVSGRKILCGVEFSVDKNETVVLLGPNGAGKSTVAAAIMGNPKFKVAGEIKFLGQDISKLSVDKKAGLGIFASFQNPVEVPGVTTTEMLRTIMEEKKGGFVPLDTVREEITKNAKKLGQNIWFSERELNVGFSGGEKKKNEILQMLTLKPKLVILDEIDSGLDVDAGAMISKVLADYQKESGCSYLIITHNMRVLKHLKPSKAVLLNEGQVTAVGDAGLVKRVEKQGFKAILNEICQEGEK
ncbi:Fe-S cluster assembly ATPase SufC [Candidatus Saccharibacteria bacterium]|nr:Fe-S cluster assembly ATPase SufC [Candidatus Saccharibacteria bacterium]